MKLVRFCSNAICEEKHVSLGPAHILARELMSSSGSAHCNGYGYLLVIIEKFGRQIVNGSKSAIYNDNKIQLKRRRVYELHIWGL